MSREDYEKLKKDDKDSTVTDIQLTTFGVKDFGFGQPYSLLNTDTLCNGKRKGVWGIVRSPDSRYFAVTVEDERAVKDLWVINSMASPRPTLETYKYQMPGEKEAPVQHLFLFDMNDNSYKEIRTSAFKDQTLRLARKPWRQKDRDRKEVASVGWATITVSSLLVRAATCTVSTSVRIRSDRIRSVRLSRNV